MGRLMNADAHAAALRALDGALDQWERTRTELERVQAENARLRAALRRLFEPSESPDGEPDAPELLDERLANARAVLSSVIPKEETR